MANILLSVLAVLLQAGVLTCLLLMIHTLNKKQKLDDLTFFFLLGSGSSLALSSVLCQVALLLLL
jgi:hypothetical protein